MRCAHLPPPPYQYANRAATFHGLALNAMEDVFGAPPLPEAPDERRRAREVFAQFDISGTGRVERRELQAALWRLGLAVQASAVAELLREADDTAGMAPGGLDVHAWTVRLGRGVHATPPAARVVAPNLTPPPPPLRSCWPSSPKPT